MTALQHQFNSIDCCDASREQKTGWSISFVHRASETNANAKCFVKYRSKQITYFHILTKFSLNKFQRALFIYACNIWNMAQALRQHGIIQSIVRMIFGSTNCHLHNSAFRHERISSIFSFFGLLCISCYYC